MAITRVDDDTLVLHLEVALSAAPPSLLAGLADSDSRQRYAAVGEIVRQLVGRLRRFDIRSEDTGMRSTPQQSLLPQDFQPIGLCSRVREIAE